ncbi:MAG TPA: DUF389 domain-containing protein, partial [Candidatus Xenobia bacterium]
MEARHPLLGWLPRLSAEQEETVVGNIFAAGRVSAPYFILLLLATIIATYGLVTNSTPTIIGAMIVAPLMGPIVGLGLAAVRGDRAAFSRAASAEAAGIVLVLLASALVALLVGPKNIDMRAAEIVNRTRPTLYDLVVGFAAGLAAAYCQINPRVNSSLAGVAIAVSLVPPLCVTGLSLTGVLAHRGTLAEAMGSLMLFVANFLSIQLASLAVFLAAGLGELNSLLSDPRLRSALAINLLLLGLMGWFLGSQLEGLLQERHYRIEMHDLLAAQVDEVPGAILRDLDVHEQGQVLNVSAMVNTPEEFSPAAVGSMEDKLAAAVHRPVELQVHTVVTYTLDRHGRMYQPPVPQTTPDPRQVYLQQVQGGLKSALGQFPGATLQTFHVTDPDVIQVDLSAPYPFTPELVGQLQDQVNLLLHGPRPVALVVRSTVAQIADASTWQEVLAPGTVPAPAWRVFLLGAVDRLVSAGGVRMLAPPEVTEHPHTVDVSLDLQTPQPVEGETVRLWEKLLQRAVPDRPVRLTVTWSLGNVVSPTGTLLDAAALRGKLAALVAHAHLTLVRPAAVLPND